MLGPHHTQDREPVTNILQALSLVEKAEPVQVRCFTLRLRDQHSMWLQDGCQVFMSSCMASNGSCFVLAWIIFKNHLLEVGLTQNRETKALWTLTIVGFILFYHVWGLTWIENSLNRHLVEGLVTYDFILHLRVRDHTTWLWRCVGTALGHFSFGLSQFHGHDSWLVCEVALNSTQSKSK
jgi:hypothetical protein